MLATGPGEYGEEQEQVGMLATGAGRHVSNKSRWAC